MTNGLLPLRSYRKTIVVVLLLGIVFVVLKAPSFGMTAGDHGVYYYGAKLLVNGLVPYRDFFYAHPPLHIALLSLLIAISDTNIHLLNLIPTLCSLVIGLTVFWMLWRTHRTTSALIAAILTLFSYGMLAFGSFYTGHVLALMFLLLGVACIIEQKPHCAGLMLAMGALSNVHVLVATVVTVVWLLVWDKKEAWKTASMFFVVWLLVQLSAFWWAGELYIEQVYGYHLSKPAAGIRLEKPGLFFVAALRTHIVHAILGALFFVYLARNRRKAWQKALQGTEPLNRLLTLCASLWIAYLLFLVSLQRVFLHYFLPLIPALSIMGSMTLIWLKEKTVALCEMSTGQRCIMTSGVVIVLVLLTISTTTSIRWYLFDQAYKSLPHAHAMAATINRDLKEDETLFGDIGVAPLIALIANRRIAADMPDSSVQRIESGLISTRQIIEAIDNDNVGAVLTREVRGIGTYFPFRKYLERQYDLVQVFTGKGSGTAVEYWRKRK